MGALTPQCVFTASCTLVAMLARETVAAGLCQSFPMPPPSFCLSLLQGPLPPSISFDPPPPLLSPALPTTISFLFPLPLGQNINYEGNLLGSFTTTNGASKLQLT